MQNCGSHGNNCANQIADWAAGTCSGGVCVVSACLNDKSVSNNQCVDAPPVVDCQEGFHNYENGCEPDSARNCGQHNNDCANIVPDWADGSCTNGSCVVSSCLNDKIVSGNKCMDQPNPEDPTCNDGQHLYSGACEDDDVQNCGAHGYNCSAAILNWAEGSCTNGGCVVTSCQNQMHVSKNSCVSSGGDPVNPPDPSDSVDPELTTRTAASDDCSGNPASSSNPVMPIWMVVGAACLGLLRRRREN